MSNPSSIPTAETVLQFLHTFDRAARHEGDVCFSDGRVTALDCEVPGAVTATVTGTENRSVWLRHNLQEGWVGECDCPRRFKCEHLYATAKALLAEITALQVQKLSAGLTPRTPKAAQSTPARTASFPDQIEEGLGRPLKLKELTYLECLHRLYARARANGYLTGMDLGELGITLGGYAWHRLQLWPTFPQTEHKFWLYLANAALEKGLKIPEFMAPVTDLAALEELIQRWRRQREVDHWKSVLGQVPLASAGSSSRRMVDLRLRFTDEGAVLQCQREGSPGFESMSARRLEQFERDYKSGAMHLSLEAELIWNCFEQRQPYLYAPGMLAYDDEAANRNLAWLVRHPSLESRLVTAEGQIYARPPEPLRWEMSPAQNPKDDYRLRLLCADGTAVPPVLCVLSGHPTIYVTGSAFFRGPPVPVSEIKLTEVTLIPAPALETRNGIALIQSLGIELPPRVRDRVRHSTVQVTLRCELKTIAASGVEVCLVHAVGESSDGQICEQWNGTHWNKVRSAKERSTGTKNEIITLYDRSALETVPDLLEPLRIRWDPYGESLSVRVSKKFPELFVSWLKTVPPHIVVKLEGELASLAADPVRSQVQLEVVEAAIDWFDLTVVLNVTDTTLSPEEIKLLLSARGGYVRLKAKGWRRLEFALTPEEDARLAELGLNPHALTAEPQRLHALQLATAAAAKFLPKGQVEQIQRRAAEIKARVTPDLPSGLQAELRPYQREGFNFLAYLSTNRFGGILADDMGLGKTLQTLAWLLWLREQCDSGGPALTSPTAPLPAVDSGNADGNSPDASTDARRARPSLVVCPKSVTDNWRAEVDRFTPGLRIKVWSANELPLLSSRLAEADLHVINYTQLRLLGESLVPIEWLALILDEGQYIKNPNSQTAQVARALRAQHRLVLSGTPIENRLLDLWSLMAFAMPGALGSRPKFAQVYDAKGDPLARRRLSARVRPFLLRRTKTQVAPELPDRIEEDLFCDIEGEQQLLYRAEFKRAQQLLLRIKTQKELAKEQFHFLVALLRLRQICCDPRLVKPDAAGPSAKIEALSEQIEPLMEEGHKVLVFSQFVQMLDLIRPALAAKGWPIFYLTGDTENRGELVARFQASTGPAIFLISLKAGGFGLNLTAASYVVLFDPWWNPAVENQAIDRTHRIGQNRKVIAYRLLIKDSIEEKIRRLQKQKGALAEDVLGEEQFAQSLTLEDLRFLFAD